MSFPIKYDGFSSIFHGHPIKYHGSWQGQATGLEIQPRIRRDTAFLDALARYLRLPLARFAPNRPNAGLMWGDGQFVKGGSGRANFTFSVGHS
jgi:hypothetical protein